MSPPTNTDYMPHLKITFLYPFRYKRVLNTAGNPQTKHTRMVPTDFPNTQLIIIHSSSGQNAHHAPTCQTFGLDPKLTLLVIHNSSLNDQRMDHVFSEDGLGGRIGRKTSYKGMPPDSGESESQRVREGPCIETCTRQGLH